MSVFDDLLRGAPNLDTRTTAPPIPLPNEEPTVVNVVGPPRTNYDNSKAVQGTQAALANPESQPDGGTAGAWGLLPKEVKHGTLRNILGLIGDSFLMGSGGRPEYQDAVQRQALGTAMAGFQKDPGAAASRIAALGVPDSADIAMKMFDQYQTNDLRKQAQAQNDQYKQDQTQARSEMNLQRMIPYVGAMVNDPSIKDKASYAKAFARADAMAKRINPEYSAMDFGLVDPEEWQPAVQTTAGATAGQMIKAGTSGASIAERGRATDIAHQDRIRGQNLTAKAAAARTAKSSGSQPTAAAMVSKLMAKQNSGQKLTPAEQTFWDKQTAKSGASGGRALPAGLKVGGAGAGKSYQGSPVYDSPNDAAFKKLPKGAKFYVQGDTTPRYKK